MKQADLLQKCIEALESGKYRQYKGGSLSSNYGQKNQSFCCLGVMSVVAKENGVLCERTRKQTDTQIEHGSFLTKKLAKRLGISTAGEFLCPVTYRGRVWESLVELNDAGVRFKTIARIFREQLEQKNMWESVK